MNLVNRTDTETFIMDPLNMTYNKKRTFDGNSGFVIGLTTSHVSPSAHGIHPINHQWAISDTELLPTLLEEAQVDIDVDGRLSVSTDAK